MMTVILSAQALAYYASTGCVKERYSLSKKLGLAFPYPGKVLVRNLLTCHLLGFHRVNPPSVHFFSWPSAWSLSGPLLCTTSWSRDSGRHWPFNSPHCSSSSFAVLSPWGQVSLTLPGVVTSFSPLCSLCRKVVR